MQKLSFEENNQLYNELLNHLYALGVTQKERIKSFAETLEKVLNKGYDINFYHNRTEGTLLRRAVRCLQTEIAALLIVNGADVNITDTAGNNILMTAVTSVWNPDFLSLVASQTQEINRKNINGQTALGLQCAKYLASTCLSTKPDFRSVLVLLKAGANPDIDTSWHQTKTNEETALKDYLIDYIQNFLTTIEELNNVEDQTFEYEL